MGQQMDDWNAGYRTEIDYTHGYYPELNPLHITLAFLKAGLAMPRVGTACELGFGQGLSVNVHAAAAITEWHGTDFNPSQAAFAQELASVSGAKATLQDDAFEAFATREDLPDFDFIGLHGIWSWISDANRAVLVDFIRRKLKVGGVLYISYNTQPGWAAFGPMRHLMAQHAEVMGAEGGGILSRVEGAIGFADKLLKTNPTYARANPAVAERIEKLKSQNRQYLVHEYFNAHWQPMPFADMADWLAPAKLQFACSASYPDHVDSINLTGDQKTLLQEIPDPVFRESVRDFMVNRQFRKDYWVKGVRKANVIEQAETLKDTRILLTTPRDQVALTLNGALGEATLAERIYAPILDQLADHKPKTLGQLEKALAEQGVRMSHLLEAALLLAGTKQIALVQEDDIIRKARKHTDALNTRLMSLARSSQEISYLASPVTGGGVSVNRFEQLFLLAYKQGQKQPEAWARFVWQLLSSQGQKLVKAGKTLDAADDNVKELTEQATTFAEQRLPILKALQVAV